MQLGHRICLLCALSVCSLAGCKFDEISGSGTDSAAAAAAGAGASVSASGSNSAPTGGAPSSPGAGAATMPGGNSIVATPSIAGTVTVTVGARQTLSVTFTSSDGLAISGFAISGTTLPDGWSGPDVFTCLSASTGNDCVLNLTYAPLAAEAGSLTLSYIYIDHAGVRRTPGGSLTIPYAATVANNISAVVSPSGQVNARVGAGTQSVSVNFTTDDGNAATDLTLATDLSTLPPDWRGVAPAFSCGIVSMGNGCQLMLSYTPANAANGMLSLNYRYVDDSGAARSGALNIPYATTANGSVVATVSPAGQVNAVQKSGGQPVEVTFTTDDGSVASGLVVSSDLRALAPGWSSESSSCRCTRVETGNGCQLRLNYAPSTLANGEFTLGYVYNDASGTFKTGSVNIAYASTTDNNITGTALPSGQINAVVGQGAQDVSVTFTSDDGRPVTDLTLAGDQLPSPSGWSGVPADFRCIEVAAGSVCALSLMYAPGMADAGTLALKYAYINNAGKPRTGTVGIPYRATTDDDVIGTPSVASVVATTGTSTIVGVAFATDDGNPAGNLTITSGLAALPAGWSSASNSFSCLAVSSGGSCILTLNFSPTAAGSGTVTLGFSYTNNSGIVKTGSTSISFSAQAPTP